MQTTLLSYIEATAERFIKDNLPLVEGQDANHANFVESFSNVVEQADNLFNRFTPYEVLTNRDMYSSDPDFRVICTDAEDVINAIDECALSMLREALLDALATTQQLVESSLSYVLWDIERMGYKPDERYSRAVFRQSEPDDCKRRAGEHHTECYAPHQGAEAMLDIYELEVGAVAVLRVCGVLIEIRLVGA